MLGNLPVVSIWLLQTVVAIHDIKISLVVVAAIFVILAATAELASATVAMTVVLSLVEYILVGIGLVPVVGIISVEIIHCIHSYTASWL